MSPPSDRRRIFRARAGGATAPGRVRSRGASYRPQWATRPIALGQPRTNGRFCGEGVGAAGAGPFEYRAIAFRRAPIRGLAELRIPTLWFSATHLAAEDLAVLTSHA